MMKLVYISDLKSEGRNTVSVRLRLAALEIRRIKMDLQVGNVLTWKNRIGAFDSMVVVKIYKHEFNPDQEVFDCERLHYTIDSNNHISIGIEKVNYIYNNEFTETHYEKHHNVYYSKR